MITLRRKSRSGLCSGTRSRTVSSCTVEGGRTVRPGGRPEAVDLAAMHDPSTSRGVSTRLIRSASRIRGDYPLVLIDIVLAAFTYFLLFELRFDFTVPTAYWN